MWSLRKITGGPAPSFRQAQCSTISRLVFAQQQVIGGLAQSRYCFFGRASVIQAEVAISSLAQKVAQITEVLFVFSNQQQMDRCAAGGGPVRSALHV